MYLHLSRLKARILPPETATAARFDARLEALARDLSTAFDAYTGRSLVRGVDVSQRFPGGSGYYALDRYPVEAITSATLVQGDHEIDIAPWIARLSKRAGLVTFSRAPGGRLDDVEIVYTGGYYVDLSAEGNGETPADATAMPDDLLGAWVAQCDYEARARKIFGTTSDQDLAGALTASLELVPRVERTLRAYMRL